MFEGFATTRIEVNGIGLHVVHGGRGPAVLLLHGYPQTHVMWHKVAPDLARTRTVIAPDMRGYGDSDKAYFDFLMERWCATPGALTAGAYAEYERCFCDQAAVDSTCAEYRSVELDLRHDEADRQRKLTCPMLVLWGRNTSKRPGWQTGARLDMLGTWRERAVHVRGHGLDCGHFVPEERPREVVEAMLDFYAEIDCAA